LPSSAYGRQKLKDAPPVIRLAITLAAASLVVAWEPGDAQVPTPCEKYVFQGEHVSIRDEGVSGPFIVLAPVPSRPRAICDSFNPDLKAAHHVFAVQINGFGGDAPRGGLGPGLMKAVVAEIHDHIPWASHIFVAEAGHFLMLDQPFAFAAAIKIFLS
jgi:hypothetical protein